MSKEPHIEFRDGYPAVCVKAYSVTNVAGDLAAELGEDVANAVWEDLQESFWNFAAPHLADEHGYGTRIYSAGRSSGWLIAPDAPKWWEYIDVDEEEPAATPCCYCTASEEEHDDETGHLFAPDRDHFTDRARFIGFAMCIQAEADYYAGELFEERLSEELAELEDRREACLIRGTS